MKKKFVIVMRSIVAEHLYYAGCHDIDGVPIFGNLSDAWIFYEDDEDIMYDNLFSLMDEGYFVRVVSYAAAMRIQWSEATLPTYSEVMKDDLHR